MTRAEAQSEAERRWGPNAVAYGHYPCDYGCRSWVSGGYGPEAPFGSGFTFEEAFADAAAPEKGATRGKSRPRVPPTDKTLGGQGAL